MMNLQTECAECGAQVTGAEIVSALVRGVALGLRDWITPTMLIRAKGPEISALAASLPDGLMQAGILTDGSRDTIIAMADRQEARAAANTIEVTAPAAALAREAN